MVKMIISSHISIHPPGLSLSIFFSSLTIRPFHTLFPPFPLPFYLLHLLSLFILLLFSFFLLPFLFFPLLPLTPLSPFHFSPLLSLVLTSHFCYFSFSFPSPLRSFQPTCEKETL